MGKGTQCTRLAKDLDLVHVSVGDLLRAEAKRPRSEQKTDILSYIQNGTLVPAEITQGLLENHIVQNVRIGRIRFLVDGFPRDMKQTLLFEEHVRDIDPLDD